MQSQFRPSQPNSLFNSEEAFMQQHSSIGILTVDNLQPENSNVSTIPLPRANPPSDDALGSQSSPTPSQLQILKLKISRTQLESIPKREKHRSGSAADGGEDVGNEARETLVQLSPKRSRVSMTNNDPTLTEPPRKRLKTEPRFEGPIHVQDRRCYLPVYRDWSKCLACVAKKPGEPCRFVGIRGFRVSENGTLTGQAQFHGLPSSDQRQNVSLNFNRDWYQPPDDLRIRRIKQTVAKIILPNLQFELTQIAGNSKKIIRRPRETEVRVTCDRCLTSIFSISYICTLCGREFCFDCYTSLEDIKTVKYTHIGRNSTGYYKCCFLGGQYSMHDARMFLPVSRLGIEELEANISEMKQTLGDDNDANIGMEEEKTQNGPVDMGSVSETTGQHQINAPEPHINANRSDSPTEVSLHLSQTSSRDSSLTPLSSESDPPVLEVEERGFPLAQPSIDPVTGVHVDPAGIESLPIDTFDYDLDEELFTNLWKDGKSLVVHGLLEKMTIDWTPEYFIQHYGEETCWITDCDSQSTTEATVANFFAQFGQYNERDQKILKLKDWPPTSDFKVTFPKLFEDFQSAVPVPNYTRRDGFYNISTHFPANVVAPDMGPKMYNAFASREDGHGSTRLHMDMADAVNIMLYASPPPGQTIGVAVWDIYPSTVTNTIREFLREEFPPETSPIQYVDPIHSQYFYLTPKLRRKIFDKYGVRGWRIYQKPGDAVFIPAGCAHQVCNLADCMKVAVDFVSPENLDRCGQLTKEFREENQEVTWKEDILQLTNMCWNAWVNTKQLEEEISAKTNS